MDRATCLRLPDQQLTGIGGLDFKIQTRDCALIGSSWKQDVSVSSPYFWKGWDEIFAVAPNFILPKYDPSPVTIDVDGHGDITISVSTISEVDFQKPEWEGHKIHYRIGHIDYGNPRQRELNDLACCRIPPLHPDLGRR